MKNNNKKNKSKQIPKRFPTKNKKKYQKLLNFNF